MKRVVLALTGFLFIFGSGGDALAQTAAPPAMGKEEFEQAKRVYFDRCAGCHGVLRKGATGPKLLPGDMQKTGTAELVKTITEGTVKGMPDWGRQGILSPAEVDLMARYVQQEPPVPPEMSLKQMKDTWKVFVEPDKRPKKPEHNRDWENFFSVTLRDAGQVAIIDGNTKEILNTRSTTWTPRRSRCSACPTTARR